MTEPVVPPVEEIKPIIKSKSSRDVAVITVWQQPKHGFILIKNEAGEQRLMPEKDWEGARKFSLTEDIWGSLKKPDAYAVLEQAELTPESLNALFARVGIISPETVSREAVMQVMQLILAKVDLLK